MCRAWMAVSPRQPSQNQCSTTSKGSCRMSDALYRRSALGEFPAAASRASTPRNVSVHLTERPFFGHLNVRADPNNEALLEKIQRCLGLSLPLEPNTVSESSTLTVLW